MHWKPKDPQYEDNTGGKQRKKKVDREAMQSAIMRIPRMDVRVARDLIDIGIKRFMNCRKICRKPDGRNKGIKA